ncbi:macrophage erythroblast attacher isoform 1 [Moniliophthora roreri]|nr:macrophage erythroblast attacher isoform 1 [Moniliophthora roreri]
MTSLVHNRHNNLEEERPAIGASGLWETLSSPCITLETVFVQKSREHRIYLQLVLLDDIGVDQHAFPPTVVDHLEATAFYEHMRFRIARTLRNYVKQLWLFKGRQVGVGVPTARLARRLQRL